MSFRNPTISEPQLVDPERCRAEFLGEVGSLSRRMTAEEIAQNDAKQRAYEESIRKYRDSCGIKKSD
jgi:hypothetical protein